MSEDREPYYKVYRQVGKTSREEAIYENLETGHLLIEKDFTYLCVPEPGEIEGATWWYKK